jgi:tol-pal system-associated acyl-CoA thioesterase
VLSLAKFGPKKEIETLLNKINFSFMIKIMSKSHIYKLKVFVEDVDFGRVFYSRYLQYIERARTELIHEKFGLTLTQLMNEHEIMFVVRECNIKYLKSAVFEDNLSIETTVLKKTNVRLNLLQEVKRDGEVLVSAEVELAVVDRSGSIKKLSKDFFTKI